MKVTEVITHLLSVPLAEPVITSIHRITEVATVAVEVRTDQDVHGSGYVFAPTMQQGVVLEAMINDLAVLVQGEDARFVAHIWARLWQHINFMGHAGLTVQAMSPLDTALWDIIGKVAGMPLYQLLGAYTDRLLLYHSGGLWLGMTLDELVRQAQTFVEQGFKAMKLRLGRPSMQEDVERVRAVRQAIGPDIQLLTDVNQGWAPNDAIRIGRRLEEFDLYWLEEPTTVDDGRGNARVAAALDTPVAGGETVYTRYGIHTMLQQQAADIVMPDLARMGGISEWRRAAALAAAYNIPVSNHIYTEVSMHLMASCANGLITEYMPWFGALLTEPMQVRDGYAYLPERPGVGITFDRKALQTFRV
jgi:L-alanine-DL-glutamate epimerase-like enolase superfamily enzyme